MYYAFITTAAVLLAVSFAGNKQYQAKNGAGMPSAFLYAALVSAFTLIPLLVMKRFHIEGTLFSWAMAAVYSVCVTVYQTLGFVIMKKSNVALYTLFIMTGGMILPYLWGLLFWNEPFSPCRTIGLVCIVAAVVLSSSGKMQLGFKQLLLCLSVFVLNGLVSVSAKYNQSAPAGVGASTFDFMMMTSLIRLVLSLLILLFLARKPEGRPVAALKARHTWVLTLGVTAVSMGSNWLQLDSASHLPATVVYPFLTGGTIAFTAIAGWVFFRERISPRSWASIACCLVGTCLFL